MTTASLGELPDSGPVAEFAAGAEVLSRPTDPRRPWVLARGDRVMKAYDLRAFDALDRRRALAEAETAIELADLEGVVETFAAEEVEGWLAIEMQRLGETLAERLERTEAGEEEALSPARWGKLLEEAAAALGRIHRRKVVHRDVKPSNLMFDRSGERLVVADFSIAARGRDRAGGREGQGPSVAGTRRYIAPEVFSGRVGYAADQYGLAVTAEDVLGEQVTPAARETLLRATEQEPEDRFATVEDFGVALRSAIDDRAPYRIARRLRRISPKWRATWGLGAVTFVAIYGLILALRVPDMTWPAGLLLPAMGAGLTMVVARMLFRVRSSRTTPRLGMANRPWFPLALFCAIIFALRPLLANEPGDAGKYMLYGWLGSMLAAAALGSAPREPGEWLIRLARRWERWRQGQRQTSAGRWLPRAGVLVVLAAVSALPTVVSSRWPDRSVRATASSSPAMVVVARSRGALMGGDLDSACALTLVPAERGIVPCRRWAPLAARWLRRDRRRRGAPTVVDFQLGDLRISRGSDFDSSSAPYWNVWTDDGDRDYVASLTRIDEAGAIWEVEITRDRPSGTPTDLLEAHWSYEVVRRDGRWAITGVEVCDFSSHDDCARIAHVPRSDWHELVRAGPPGRG